MRIVLAIAVTLLLTACGELTLDNPNGRGPDPTLSIAFQNGSAFPHASSADDLLIMELDSTDIGDPTRAVVYIDGDKVLTLSRSGGHNTVGFPPPTWTPSTGGHVVRVVSMDIARELTFTWQ
jgi:hypothetical protein